MNSADIFPTLAKRLLEFRFLIAHLDGIDLFTLFFRPNKKARKKPMLFWNGKVPRAEFKKIYNRYLDPKLQEEEPLRWVKLMNGKATRRFFKNYVANRYHFRRISSVREQFWNQQYKLVLTEDKDVKLKRSYLIGALIQLRPPIWKTKIPDLAKECGN